MLLDNRFAVLVLGVLVGIATNISFVGAHAYLLSVTEPVYALYITIVEGILFSIFLRYFKLNKLKFSHFTVIIFILMIIFHYTLTMPVWSDIIKSVVWFFLAFTGMSYFRWSSYEMSILHLDPARGKAYFSYLVTSYEIGLLIAVLGLRAYPQELPPDTMILISIFFYAIVALFVFFQFCSKRNIEIRFSKDQTPPKTPKNFRSFLIVYVLLYVCVVGYHASGEYLVNIMLKDRLQSYDAIRITITNFLIVSSCAIILGGFLIGRMIEKYHISPITLYSTQVVVMACILVMCIFTTEIYYYMIFEVFRRTTQSVFLSPANKIINASFVGALRYRLRSMSTFFSYLVASIPLFLVLGYVSEQSIDTQRYFSIGLAASFLIIISVIIYLLSKKITDLMYYFSHSKNKTAAIYAIQVLSFLKPKNFVKTMTERLLSEPKKLIKKNIIIGLSYDYKKNTDILISKQFSDAPEEIQMTVLEALSRFKAYQAKRFLLNVVTSKIPSKSLRVRMFAIKIVAKSYGEMAIPIILNGLDDKNYRIIANTLETLAAYKNKNLIPYFYRFIDSPIPRIRANALMGLYYFSECSDDYQKGLIEALKPDNDAMAISVIYLLGRLKDKNNKGLLDKLYKKHNKKNVQLEAVLAWALSQFRDHNGYILMTKLLSKKYKSGEKIAIIHFLSQLSKETRFDLIEYIGLHCQDVRVNTGQIKFNLKKSYFDFHEEIDYLNIIIAEIKQSGKPNWKALRK